MVINNMLVAGMQAPDFEAETQKGKIRLSRFRGKTVVLYFYPKDDTPGCTKEACSFRDNLPLLEKSGAVVIGVSKDSVDSHKEFAEKYKLNFHLVADPDGEICKTYGADKGFGASAKRMTFIINKQGKIAHVFPNVNPEHHSKEVLEFLKKMK